MRHQAVIDVDQIRAAEWGTRVGGKELHESHSLQFWARHSLTFCARCGFTATVDPRRLMNPCTLPTRKGK
eukprot:5826081-Pyramimonas_sp.AAC.1